MRTSEWLGRIKLQARTLPIHFMPNGGAYIKKIEKELPTFDTRKSSTKFNELKNVLWNFWFSAGIHLTIIPPNECRLQW